jgi:hypothetical protein
MFSTFMLALSLMLSRVRVCGLAILSLVTLAAGACEKVPLLAPSGSTITLTASTNALPVNGSVDIVAQIIEASGTPPHSGTHVIFTTTLGTIQPSEATTDVNGRVVVRFLSGGSNGTATITASSGAANTGSNGALRISVGSAAVGRVILNASPATVPAIGGSTSIIANVLDVNGNPLSSVPVTFSTTAGTLAASLVVTDQNGVGVTSLTTGQQATVTASVGATAPTTPTTPTTPGTPTTPTTPTNSGQASASVTVNVASAPAITITPPSTPPSVGVPASFTINVTVAQTGGSAIRNVRVNWGDGDSDSLGAVTGNAVVSHVYMSAGTFPVTVTATDASGNSSDVGTFVTVIPVPRPTIIVNYSPVPARVNTQTTINIQVTVPQGIGIVETIVDFGDGQSANLGGAASASVPHVYTAQGTYTVTVRVRDTTGQETIGTLSISVGP